jgi:hypothetical protein
MSKHPVGAWRRLLTGPDPVAARTHRSARRLVSPQAEAAPPHPSDRRRPISPPGQPFLARHSERSDGHRDLSRTEKRVGRPRAAKRRRRARKFRPHHPITLAAAGGSSAATVREPAPSDRRWRISDAHLAGLHQVASATSLPASRDRFGVVQAGQTDDAAHRTTRILANLDLEGSPA